MIKKPGATPVQGKGYAPDAFDWSKRIPGGPVKRDLWEGGHRVPFVVRWRGVVAAGEVRAALISQVDLMATFAAITGFTLPAGAAEDGHDLLAMWKDRAASPRRAIVHNTQPNGYALRQDQWVLIAARSGGISRIPPWFDPENNYKPHDQPGELYDLSKDLAQRNNLYAQLPEKVAQLQETLKTIRAKGQVR